MFFTQLGLRLLAKVQAGAALAFTRVAVGDGYVQNGQDPTTFTALVDQKMSLSINSIVVTDPQATICAVLSNVGLSTGFYWREIGVFATDPDLGEILYGYDNAGSEAEFVPPASQSSFTAVCNTAVIISNASSVTATINPYLPAHASSHMGGADPINPAGIGAFALGNSNANTQEVKTLAIDTDTRSVNAVRTNGKISSMSLTDPNNGNAVVEAITVNRTNGLISSMVKTAGARTITYTVNRTNGQITSITKAVA